jgi:2-iminobutanoate/2-iminopropanoate deaminase
MNKIIPEVPVTSAAMRKMGVPLSPVVKAGGFVYVSGMPPLDLETGVIVSGDIAAQTELALKNVKRALESAGSSLDKVVKEHVYCANTAYYRIINDIYCRYFTGNFPARTFVPVASWPMEFDVEIDCVAIE